MGYVISNLPDSSQSTQKLSVCEDFTGGVCFGSDSLQTDGKIPYMYNMINDSGVLRTRDTLTSLINGKALEGEFFGGYQKEFAKHVIIHVGKYLAAVNSTEDKPVILYDNMPVHKSLMICFCGKLYIYCNTYVFSVDSNLNFKEEIPEPLHFVFDAVAHGIPKNEHNYNLLAPIVSVTYTCYTGGSHTSYAMPGGHNPDRPVYVYCEGKLVDKSLYTVTEGSRVKILDDEINDNSDRVKFVYYVKNPSDIGFENIFDKYTVAESYGGEMLSGTRVYVSGDAENPGKIQISELMNPLCFFKDSHVTVGGDIDNIIGFIRQYGRLVLFTKNNVMRMMYDFADGRPVYTFKEINSQLGCDMPGSIQLIDNRVVFANSSKGIFIIDSTEDFGEQNIKPISENINRGNNLAFLECSQEDKLNAVSADFDRKYVLAVGDRMYIWDYGNVPFYDSGNYSKAQKRLEWYVNTGEKVKYLLESEGKLVCVYEKDGVCIGVYENTGRENGVPVHWCYESEKLTFGYPAFLKLPEKLVLVMKNDFSGRMTVFVGDENGEYFRTEIFADSNNGKYNRFALMLPRKNVRRMSFRIEGDMPVQLYSAAVYYRMSRKQR